MLESQQRHRHGRSFRRRQALGLRTKLTLPLLLLVATLAFLFETVSTEILRRQLESNLRERAEQAVTALAREAEHGALFRGPSQLRALCAEALATSNVTGAGLFDTSGRPLDVVGEGSDRLFLVSHWNTQSEETLVVGNLKQPTILAGRLVRAPAQVPESASSEAPAYAISGSAIVRPEAVLATAAIAVDTSDANAILSRWHRMALLMTVSFLALGSLASVIIVGVTLAPLRRLHQGTRKVAGGDLDVAVRCTSHDEVGELAASFNEMVGRLKRSRAELAEYNRGLEEEVDRRTAALRQAQEKLAQNEKLSALGQLVAGVAHDLNNPLGAILGYAQLLGQKGGGGKRARWLGSIEEEVHRGRDIVRNLLLFAQQRSPELQAVDLRALAQRTVEGLSRQTLVGLDVSVELAEDLPPALGDPHQLQEVLVNLLTNAAQALESEEDEHEIQVTASTADGRIELRIDDNGPGVPLEIRQKVLEPFFTTKPMGTGTGLGLSICYGILKRHDGELEISDSPLGGARFMISLPMANANELSEHAIPASHAPVNLSSDGNGESILVVEDEPSISEIIETVLNTHNYHVDTVASVGEARDRLASGTYAVILSDFQLSDGNARELHERSQAGNAASGTSFLVVTGDTVNPETRAFLDETGCPVLAKPFEIADLLDFVAKSVPSRH